MESLWTEIRRIKRHRERKSWEGVDGGKRGGGGRRALWQCAFALLRHSQSLHRAPAAPPPDHAPPPLHHPTATMVEKGKSRKDEVVTRDYTINLHKRLHGCTFKKMAPKAVKEIRKFAQKAMGTSDVRLDVKLNKHIWSRGVRNVPTRVRVRIARKRNDDEDAKEELYSYVSVAEIPAEGLRNLGTKIVEEED
ncbi:hypothetical protein M758_5G076800 [Ceratodon purpureus]|nr:hypothetical protein M758_5G076800 [Ceratodon purpureus]